MEKKPIDSFRTLSKFKSGGEAFYFFRLGALAEKGFKNISRLPYSIRVLLENLLRNEDGKNIRKEHIENLAGWTPEPGPEREILFSPARVILQDFTGVPAVADLAALRDQFKTMGGDPKTIDPIEPVDLVIDHSVQVDFFGTPDALEKNMRREYERNGERYRFLRWGQKAFRNFRVIPPGTGIVHQVNLEYLAQVVMTQPLHDGVCAYPDTLVGTDSHTTMINGLGVLGWGVGGIEAEAAMLGQPVPMLVPEVVGVRISGALREGVTATDAVLAVTEMLRKQGVVGKFVEFFGPGLTALSLADRATIANMAPEYGATMGFFPVDRETIQYLRLTGRSENLIKLVETYCREQGLFCGQDSPEPVFSKTLALDLAEISTCLAGPRRPQDRALLGEVASNFKASLPSLIKKGRDGTPAAEAVIEGRKWTIRDGTIAIAAITSCTNTSNPSLMIAAGLVAKKASEKGLRAKPWVKSSLAPGSQVVTGYLEKTGLLAALERTGFYNVGYGCMTCIGNSGPLIEGVDQAVRVHSLVVASVLSGNRNFEGRIHPLVRANYLASPPLVVAYALAGRMDLDLEREALAEDREGKPVYLKDLWPSEAEIKKVLREVDVDLFKKQYKNTVKGDAFWESIQFPEGETFAWEKHSTYIKRPPFLEGLGPNPVPPGDIHGARALVVLGDSVTTDHISPAGSIPAESPAGKYLLEQGVRPEDFNSYGARRGNHEVMVRGTFANGRLKNLLMLGKEGGWTRHFPDGKEMTIFEAAMKYRSEGAPTLVLAGKEYGAGSSRDWAAKGPALLGVRAVIAESFERIHRSNLIGMGILPLEFTGGHSIAGLGLKGDEVFAFEGIARDFHPKKKLLGKASSPEGEKTFEVLCRIDTPAEAAYFAHGGILPYVLRQRLAAR
ncbi:MAG: aconitate hydratase AcnA [Candidatus Omnitrophota bacterium]